MKIKISKLQWQSIGKETGWIKKEARLSLNYVEMLIKENNEKYGTNFSLGSTYGNWELWYTYPDSSGERIEAGSLRDVYNAFIKVRFMEKYRVKPSPPVPPVPPTQP